MISFNKNAYNLIFNNISDEQEQFTELNDQKKSQNKSFVSNLGRIYP